MPTLALKIPPLLLTFLFASAMWLTSFCFPKLTFDITYLFLITNIILAIAVIMVLAGVISFKRAKTTVNPINPEQTSSLVVTGIYQFTRNPMYLGFLFMLIAVALLLSNAAALVFIPMFIIYMNKFQIIHEENMLLTLFGDTYRQYLNSTRRWI